MSTDPVFLSPTVVVEGESVALPTLTPDVIFSLTGEEARHASKAMRLREGETLDVVDGLGFRVRSVVDGATADGLHLRALHANLEAPAKPQLILAQALAKGGRDEQAVETSTELGVDTIIPWQADRSVVRWEGKKAQAGRTRWQRVADAAAKQSRRARSPRVDPPMGTKPLARQLTRGDGIVLVLHESAQQGLGQTLDQLGGRLTSAESVTVVVGPEGGITQRELDELSLAGGLVVKAGGNVMRSSTAGPATFAVLNAKLGRW